MATTNHRKNIATNLFTLATEAHPEAVTPDPTNPYAFVVTAREEDGTVRKFRVLVKELG